MDKEELEKLFKQAREGIQYVGERSDAEHDVIAVSIACSLLLIADALQNQIIYVKDSNAY